MKLTVIMVNTWRNSIAIIHENSYMPYTYRTIHIELTPEQLKLIEPKKLGMNCGAEVMEEIGEVFLEK